MVLDLEQTLRPGFMDISKLNHYNDSHNKVIVRSKLLFSKSLCANTQVS